MRCERGDTPENRLKKARELRKQRRAEHIVSLRAFGAIAILLGAIAAACLALIWAEAPTWVRWILSRFPDGIQIGVLCAAVAATGGVAYGIRALSRRWYSVLEFGFAMFVAYSGARTFITTGESIGLAGLVAAVYLFVEALDVFVDGVKERHEPRSWPSGS
jgi:hypothetical protein